MPKQASTNKAGRGPTRDSGYKLLLATITDLQQLEELGDLLPSSPDGPAWLQALRQAQP